MRKYRLLIYGTGNYCMMLMDNLACDKAEIVAYVQTSPDKEMFMEKPVIGRESITEYEYDLLIIATAYENEITPSLKCIDNEKTIRMSLNAFWENRIGAPMALMRAFYCLNNTGRLKGILEKYICEHLDISIVKTEDGIFWTNKLDYIAKCMVLYNKVYSKYEMDRFICLANEHYRTSGETKLLLDLGCNIATSSIYIHNQIRDIKVIGFEPVPQNARLSEYNAIVNGFEDDIRIIQKGVSNKKGTSYLRIDKDNSGANRVVADEEEGRTLSAEMIDVDSFLRENEIPEDGVGYVWVDVEGFEGYVFEGMSRLIAGNKIPVFTEFNKQLLKEHNCYELFVEIVRNSYKSFIEVNAFVPEVKRPINEIESIDRATNVFLIK